MNAPLPNLAKARNEKADDRGPTRLRAWRRRQMVYDKAKRARRPMRLTDVPERFGVALSTWHGWEQWPDGPGFRRPDDGNMRLLFKISEGEITPDWFYPVDDWSAALAEADR